MVLELNSRASALLKQPVNILLKQLFQAMFLSEGDMSHISQPYDKISMQ